jgi:hypothetical protein
VICVSGQWERVLEYGVRSVVIFLSSYGGNGHINFNVVRVDVMGLILRSRPVM